MPLKPSKTMPTHFLCIPLVTAHSRPQLTASLSAFRSDICSPRAQGGFDAPPDAIRPVGTLHLTLGVLSFPRGEEGEGKLARAREVLLGLKVGEIWRGVRREWKGEAEEGIKITLRGLASMQPAARATVLYAPPVDQHGLLQAFCEKVRAAFREAEIMEDEGRPLLLHATLVNTVYVKGNKRDGASNDRGRGGRGGRGDKKWDRLVFDATGIIDRYEDQVWMENVPVERVAICRMGAKKVVVDGQEDEAYEVEAEVEF
ncbi:hypothetical protein N657DRAFT_598810 [Parathielavia appendiculata]|uniref:A-kinase anchor protein 7-like phosphoesterase domain-containing protein n=1 Tax=Parathielavia appendiculata TaxID=2587402 RepID=A0AAN6TYK4_9PEZI|nr:hypothetical protein N657DRAFT_598810 [Parathielavia appendiculata]